MNLFKFQFVSPLAIFKIKRVRTISAWFACLIPPLALLIFVFIMDNWNTRFAFLSGISKDCKNTHITDGFARKSISLAQMSAVAAWMREVETYGENYTLWTNADRKILKCRKINKTVYVSCVAWAKPCRLIYDQNHQKMIVHNKTALKPVTQ